MGYAVAITRIIRYNKNMKAQIHPSYFDNARVLCACGNTFTTGSTQEVIHVEICNKCHPFYTGEERFVDTASRIQKFQKKQEVAKSYIPKKVRRAQQKDEGGPKTLREMLLDINT